MTLPCVAPAVANALYDALGIRLRDLPLTAERIWRALCENGQEAIALASTPRERGRGKISATSGTEPASAGPLRVVPLVGAISNCVSGCSSHFQRGLP